MSPTTAQPHSSARMLTPYDVAETLGVSFATVMSWIRDGELIAVCASRNAKSKKPRFRIDATAFETFKASRQPIPPATKSTRRRKSTAVGKKFF